MTVRPAAHASSGKLVEAQVHLPRCTVRTQSRFRHLFEIAAGGREQRAKVPPLHVGRNLTEAWSGTNLDRNLRPSGFRAVPLLPSGPAADFLFVAARGRIERQVLASRCSMRLSEIARIAGARRPPQTCCPPSPRCRGARPR